MIKYLLCLAYLICCTDKINGQYLEINCEKPVLIYNDHVGNEWSHFFIVDDHPSSIDKPFFVEATFAYKVKFMTSEANEKYPDSASVPLGIDPAKLEWEKLYYKTLELIVKERNGKYAGNTAKWQVTIHFKKVHNRT